MQTAFQNAKRAKETADEPNPSTKIELSPETLELGICPTQANLSNTKPRFLMQKHMHDRS